MSKYHEFLKAWGKEHNVTSFFGSDKPDFIRDWHRARDGNVSKKKEPMHVETELMELAEPSMSEKVSPKLKISEPKKTKEYKPDFVKVGDDILELPNGDKIRSAVFFDSMIFKNDEHWKKYPSVPKDKRVFALNNHIKFWVKEKYPDLANTDKRLERLDKTFNDKTYKQILTAFSKQEYPFKQMDTPDFDLLKNPFDNVKIMTYLPSGKIETSTKLGTITRM